MPVDNCFVRRIVSQAADLKGKITMILIHIEAENHDGGTLQVGELISDAFSEMHGAQEDF